MAKIKTSDVFQSKEAPNQSQSVSYAMTSPDEFGRIEAERLGRMTKAGLSLATEVDRLKDEDSKIEVLDAINKAKVGLSQKTAEIYAYADPKDIPRLVEEATVKAFQPLKKNGDRYYMFNLNEAVRNEKTKIVDKANLFSLNKLYEKHQQVITETKNNISTEIASRGTDGYFNVLESEGDPNQGETKMSQDLVKESTIREFFDKFGREPTETELKDMMDETYNKMFIMLQKDYEHADLPMLKQINEYLKESKALTVEAQAENDAYIKAQSFNLESDNLVDTFVDKMGDDFTLYDARNYADTLSPEQSKAVYDKLANYHNDRQKEKTETQTKNYDFLFGLAKETDISLAEIEKKQKFINLTEQLQDKIRQLYKDKDKIGNPKLHKKIYRQIMIDGASLHETLWDDPSLSAAQTQSLINADKNRLSEKQRTEVIDIKNDIADEKGMNSAEWEIGLYNHALSWIKANPDYKVEELREVMENYTLKAQNKNFTNQGNYQEEPKKFTPTEISTQINQITGVNKKEIDAMLDNSTYNPNDFTNTVYNKNFASALLRDDKFIQAFKDTIGKYNNNWFFWTDTIKNNKLFMANYAKAYSRIIAEIVKRRYNDTTRDAIINKIAPFTIIHEMVSIKDESGNTIGLKTEEELKEIGIRK